ncbi:MAG: SufE family protein [Paludibacteraceae bacterium]|nr:SufE family protein [Paludibacteraceae bacterium]
MTINEAQDQLISEFEFLDDWLDKYQQIIDKGQHARLDPCYKTPENLIEGCQSKVWIQADYRDGKVYYQSESNTEIAGGIASMFVYVLSGHTPEEIIESEMYFIDRIGLKEHLSPTRSNGMLAMLKQMKLYAVAYKAKSA